MHKQRHTWCVSARLIKQGSAMKSGCRPAWLAWMAWKDSSLSRPWSESQSDRALRCCSEEQPCRGPCCYPLAVSYCRERSSHPRAGCLTPSWVRNWRFGDDCVVCNNLENWLTSALVLPPGSSPFPLHAGFSPCSCTSSYSSSGSATWDLSWPHTPKERSPNGPSMMNDPSQPMSFSLEARSPEAWFYKRPWLYKLITDVNEGNSKWKGGRKPALITRNKEY